LCSWIETTTVAANSDSIDTKTAAAYSANRKLATHNTQLHAFWYDWSVKMDGRCLEIM
jgi:hypothetical protein